MDECLQDGKIYFFSVEIRIIFLYHFLQDKEIERKYLETNYWQFVSMQIVQRTIFFFYFYFKEKKKGELESVYKK